MATQEEQDDLATKEAEQIKKDIQRLSVNESISRELRWKLVNDIEEVVNEAWDANYDYSGCDDEDDDEEYDSELDEDEGEDWDEEDD
jgi:hypothetical protein